MRRSTSPDMRRVLRKCRPPDPERLPKFLRLPGHLRTIVTALKRPHNTGPDHPRTAGPLQAPRERNEASIGLMKGSVDKFSFCQERLDRPRARLLDLPLPVGRGPGCGDRRPWCPKVLPLIRSCRPPSPSREKGLHSTQRAVADAPYWNVIKAFRRLPAANDRRSPALRSPALIVRRGSSTTH